jgi:hypothetical protein
MKNKIKNEKIEEIVIKSMKKFGIQIDENKTSNRLIVQENGKKFEIKDNMDVYEIQEDGSLKNTNTSILDYMHLLNKNEEPTK